MLALPRHEWLKAFLLSLAAIVSAFLLSGLIIQLAGYNAPGALGALFESALGNRYSLGETFVRSCPLLLTGLAVAFAFRCSVWNIGAEGQFLMGGLLATWMVPMAAGLSGSPGVFLTLATGAGAGAVWGALVAWLKVRRNVQEVISSIMLNFIALQLVSYAVHGPLMETAGQFPQSDPAPEGLRLVRWMEPTRLHTGVLIGLALTAVVHIVLFRTVFGYKVRAVGLNPAAARAAGINAPLAIVATMSVSGALAGLAGAVELTGVTYRLYEDFAGGYGYTAIAVALLGRLSPVGVLFAALLFGMLETGAGGMQRAAGVSAVLVYVIQALILLFIVAAMGYDQYRRRR